MCHAVLLARANAVLVCGHPPIPCTKNSSGIYGGGQVAGLLLAGIFVSDFRVGLYCSAAALLPAPGLGAHGLPVAAKRHARMTEIGTRMCHDMDWRLLATFGHAELQGGGLLRFSPTSVMTAINLTGIVTTWQKSSAKVTSSISTRSCP